MLGKKKSHIGRLHGRHAYVRRHVRASSCSCKSLSRGRHLGGRSVCPWCLARRGLGCGGPAGGGGGARGPRGPGPGQPRRQGRKWLLGHRSQTETNSQPSSSTNAASRSFQVVDQGTSLTGPLVRTRASAAVDAGSIPGQGTRIPHAMWYSKNRLKKWLITSGCQISAERSPLLTQTTSL